jgi:hypothetical protein
MPDNEQHDAVPEEAFFPTGNSLHLNPPADKLPAAPLHNERWQDVEIPAEYEREGLPEHGREVFDILERARERYVNQAPVRLQMPMLMPDDDMYIVVPTGVRPESLDRHYNYDLYDHRALLEFIRCTPPRHTLPTTNAERVGYLPPRGSMGFHDRSVTNHAIRETLDKYRQIAADQDDPNTEPPASA